MAEDITEVEDTTTESEDTTEDVPLGPAGEKALAAMKEQLKAARSEAKVGKTAQAELDRIRQEQMSNEEKLTARAEQAERRAADLEQAHVRAEVALAKGLTATQAKRLIGATREELEADADILIVDLKPGKPQGDIGQGPRPEDKKSVGDQIAEAEQAGDHRLAMSLKAQQLQALPKT